MPSCLGLFIILICFFICMDVLTVCHVFSWQPWLPKEGIILPRTGLTNCCVPQCGCWVLNSGHLLRAATTFNHRTISRACLFHGCLLLVCFFFFFGVCDGVKDDRISESLPPTSPVLNTHSCTTSHTLLCSPSFMIPGSIAFTWAPVFETHSYFSSVQALVFS